MYIPRSYAETDRTALFDFIEAHPFAAMVTASSDGLFATHLPLVLDRTRGEQGALQGHIARANPHHRLADTSDEALVIFTGPDAYITPTWYPSKVQNGKVVPTWNYVAVHAYGALRFTDDPAFLRPHLDELTSRHEKGREHPWILRDAPVEYIEQLQRAIVGVEVVVSRLEGKWKMSQNRPSEDIDGVIRGLGASPDATDQQVAEIVQARRPER